MSDFSFVYRNVRKKLLNPFVGHLALARIEQKVGASGFQRLPKSECRKGSVQIACDSQEDGHVGILQLQPWTKYTPQGL